MNVFIQLDVTGNPYDGRVNMTFVVMPGAVEKIKQAAASLNCTPRELVVDFMEHAAIGAPDLAPNTESSKS